MHWPSHRRDLYVETWRAFLRLRSEGRAKSIGVSNFAISHLQRLMNETGEAPAVNQAELHPLFQQNELREFHAGHSIATESWSPLCQAHLLANRVNRDLALKHARTPAQILLRWHLDNGLIAIPKSVHPKRIRENFSMFDFRLDAETLARISTLDDEHGRLGPDPETANF
jgi:2,5-diketo-D-gluconate reductase A